MIRVSPERRTLNRGAPRRGAAIKPHAPQGEWS